MHGGDRFKAHHCRDLNPQIRLLLQLHARSTSGLDQGPNGTQPAHILPTPNSARMKPPPAVNLHAQVNIQFDRPGLPRAEATAGLMSPVEADVDDGRSTSGVTQDNDVPVKWRRFLRR